MHVMALPAGGLNFSPTLPELLRLHLDWPMLLLWLLVGGWYLWAYLHKDQEQRWPLWRVLLFSLGLLIWFLTTQSAAQTFSRQSMALYMARLMLLAEVVPPLLVLGLPLSFQPGPRWHKLLSVLLDPWVALALWTTVIVFWNLPAGFSASLVTNTAAQLLPLLYLVSSSLIWLVILRPLTSLQSTSLAYRGWFGLLAALPMMAVSAVWLYSPQVLYSPYASALCLWNFTPLQNQQLSGWIMMLAGLPALGLALVQLMGWLIRLADGEGDTAR